MSNSRENNSTHATIDKTRLFALGSFKNVYAGTYTVGTRAGQKCVAKEFNTGSIYEDYYFEEEMNIIRCSQIIVDDWNDAGVIDKRILLNMPEIWYCQENNARCLLEPMIENFEKFNSNSGWATGTGGAWGDAMQALSHFSYHNSGGQLLLCDIQGGAYQDGYILSDPAIMSQLQTYGPTDLGPDGIHSFFRRHLCGKFCKKEWQMPKYQGGAIIPMMQGSSIVAYPQAQTSCYPLGPLLK